MEASEHPTQGECRVAVVALRHRNAYLVLRVLILDHDIVIVVRIR
jgi:hypothetical protein